MEEQVQALLAAAQDVAKRAKDDPALAEALLADPAGVIADAAGQPVPDGVLVTAARNADGSVELLAKADPDYDGELDDALLDQVAGGNDTSCRIGDEGKSRRA